MSQGEIELASIKKAPEKPKVDAPSKSNESLFTRMGIFLSDLYHASEDIEKGAQKRYDEKKGPAKATKEKTMMGYIVDKISYAVSLIANTVKDVFYTEKDRIHGKELRLEDKKLGQEQEVAQAVELVKIQNRVKARDKVREAVRQPVVGSHTRRALATERRASQGAAMVR